MAAEVLTIGEAADRLGVHYMTVYRYIRTGQLAARRLEGRWAIRDTDLSVFSSGGSEAPRRGSRRLDPSESLLNRMLEGDSRGAWAIVEQMLLAGRPLDVYLTGLAPALRLVGDRWQGGALSVAEEHRVTAVALGILGRLGPLFQRRGRRRPARVLLAGAQGDSHSIPVTIVGDVLRSDGFDVVQLGADVPAEEVVRAALSMGAPAVVGLSAATDESVFHLREAIDRLRKSVPSSRILVGGPAVDSATAVRLAADGCAPDAAAALEEVHRLVGRSRLVHDNAGGARA